MIYGITFAEHYGEKGNQLDYRPISLYSVRSTECDLLALGWIETNDECRYPRSLIVGLQVVGYISKWIG